MDHMEMSHLKWHKYQKIQFEITELICNWISMSLYVTTFMLTNPLSRV